MPLAEIAGASVYYEVKGNGPPLILLPGLGRGTSYYDAIEPTLRKDFTTIVVDPRGIGRSSKTDQPLIAEQWADDFVALLQQLKLSPAHALGSSHGGSIAMAMALQHPASVKSLLLFGAFSEIDRFIELNMNLRIRLAKKLGMGEDMRDFIALWTFGHEFLDNPKADQFLATQLTAVKEHTPEAYAAICESLLHWGRRMPGQEREPKVTTRLQNISHPTLVTCGGLDYWIPAKFSKMIAERIPNAEYVEMPRCGHIPVREDPQGCAELIKKFVTRISR